MADALLPTVAHDAVRCDSASSPPPRLPRCSSAITSTSISGSSGSGRGGWQRRRGSCGPRCGHRRGPEAAQRLLQQAAHASDPVRRLHAAHDLVAKAPKDRERDYLAVRLRALCSLLRDLALLAASSESSSANADLRADLNRLTSAFDADARRGLLARSSSRSGAGSTALRWLQTCRGLAGAADLERLAFRRIARASECACPRRLTASAKATAVRRSFTRRRKPPLYAESKSGLV